jgi:protein tyrosine phosphatase (PTP) superfamily phosphohydrolase (DUF442 family)
MTLMATTLEAPAAVPRRRPRLRFLVSLGLSVAVLPVAVEAHRVMLGRNFHAVVPGRVYRCAQPSGDALDEIITRHSIRTVINLRGSGEPAQWYHDEARATHRRNIAQEDICFSAGRLPSVPEVRRLIEVLDHTEYPILLHCRRGADRTGLAAAMVLLLTGDTDLEVARRQVSPRYGHFAVGRAAQLDQFFDYYVSWLEAEGKLHAPLTFREWATCHYRPGSCWAELAFLRPPPSAVTGTASTALELRVRNSSLLPWRLKPLVTAGTHLGCHIYDDHDRLVDVVKTGLRDGLVFPGATIDFTLVLPPLHKAGRYRLQLDMVDEQQCWFYQTGSEPLEVELNVRE